MLHTGKKERKKEKEKKGYEKFASKGNEPEPSELAKSVNRRFSSLDHLRKMCLKQVYIYFFSIVIDSFQEWLFRFLCRIKSLTDQS